MELERLLAEANRENWCTRWFCTTCSSLSFRSAILELADEPFTLSPQSARSLLDEIREINATSYPDAIEYLLRWIGSLVSESEISASLGESGMGLHYRAMLNAKAFADARRAEHDRQNDRIFVAAERARKIAERAARHQERLVTKRIRDELRHDAIEQSLDESE